MLGRFVCMSFSGSVVWSVFCIFAESNRVNRFVVMPRWGECLRGCDTQGDARPSLCPGLDCLWAFGPQPASAQSAEYALAGC